MKAILGAFFLIVTLAFPVYAAKPEAETKKEPAKAEAGNFEKRKADELERLDKRIAAMQEERACVQAAASLDALNKCNKQTYGHHTGESHEKESPKQKPEKK